jgi:hypothetical protein
MIRPLSGIPSAEIWQARGLFPVHLQRDGDRQSKSILTHLEVPVFAEGAVRHASE